MLTDEQQGMLVNDRRRGLNTLLFPGPTKEYEAARGSYGDVSVLATRDYLYGIQQGEEHPVRLGEGVSLLLGVQAISEADERGQRIVMSTVNGQLRPISVRDRSIASAAPTAEKAEPGNPDHVAAPFAGAVTPTVAVGDAVAAGDKLATIEAMKMEASITAPRAGVITRVAIRGTQMVEGGDLVAVVG